MATIDDKLIAEFRVGDKVRIRDDINHLMTLPFHFVQEMEKYKGKELIVSGIEGTITEWIDEYDKCVLDTIYEYGIEFCIDDNLKSTRYYLATDDGKETGFTWSIFMFDLKYSSYLSSANIEYETEDIQLLFT